MEDLNIKDEVYKCSKCALCQNVCPVFTASRNEKFLPRGRFNVLNKFFSDPKNNKLSKHFIDDLDVCLNCNACKDFCPSNIDSASIFTLLKYQYKKIFIPFSLKYKLILIFNSLLKNFVKNQLYSVRIKKTDIKTPVKTENVVYFQGCFNRFINPSDKNAVLNILNSNGYNVVKILNNCCGLPYLSDGQLKKYENNIEAIIKSVPKNVKYIVTSCDSCYQTLYKSFENSEFKLIRLNDLIHCCEKTENTFFYKPYSLKNYTDNLPLINKKGKYSLMENFFMLKHKRLYNKFINFIFYNKNDLEGKTIVTSCNLTKWGFIEACEMKKINTKVFSLAEYLNLCNK